MKIVIILAICCSAALAVKTPSARTKVEGLLKPFHDEIVPKFLAAKNHKNLDKILENPIGFREVFESFEEAINVIYDQIDTAAIFLVPVIQKSEGLNEALQRELPGIVRGAALKAYEETVAAIGTYKERKESNGVTAQPEELIAEFIKIGIYYSAAYVTTETFVKVFEVFDAQGEEVGNEFLRIAEEAIRTSYFAVLEFLVTLALGLETY